MPSTSTGQPEVSIVLTTYNSEKTIPHVLQALVSQDYNLGNAELIIVDDNSRDSTLRILRDFLSQYGNNFSRSELIVHDRNYGVSRARNDGIRASRGRYILILDHDVVMQKDTLTVLVKYLQSTPRRVAATQAGLRSPVCPVGVQYQAGPYNQDKRCYLLRLSETRSCGGDRAIRRNPRPVLHDIRRHRIWRQGPGKGLRAADVLAA
jgi:glycosyltransferase involved in cell wall biosynthesis